MEPPANPGRFIVDFDNAKPRDSERARQRAPDTQSDVPAILTTLFSRVRRAAANYLPGVREIEVRLYGGWVDENGAYTPLAEWVLADLPIYRSLHNGIRLLPSLCESLARAPRVRLLGTLRTETKPRNQKMVDLLLGFDAETFAPEGPVIVLSDDDDFVPAAVTCRVGQGQIHRFVWVRSASTKARPNDSQLEGLGVTLATWE